LSSGKSSFGFTFGYQPGAALRRLDRSLAIGPGLIALDHFFQIACHQDSRSAWMQRPYLEAPDLRKKYSSVRYPPQILSAMAPLQKIDAYG
jgi:hypothetical protein